MKLGLINSAWAQAGKGTAWGIQKTAEIGFDTIDIFTDPLDIDIRERRLIKTECDKAGLPIISIACVAVGLVDFNPSVQRFAIDRVKAYLDLAYEYEAHNVLVVLGEYIWNQEVIPPEEQWKTAVESMRRVGEHAERLGVSVALELEPFPLSLLNSVETMVRFIDDVGCSAVKANIDVSHLALSHTPATDLQRLAGKAIHLHISDCDGKRHGDLPPGRGVVDFPSYLKAIQSLGMNDATMSIELEYAPQPDQIEAWVREAFEATSRLMKEHGLRN